MAKVPTFVSFYTLDDYYRRHATRLMIEFRKLNSLSDIKFEFDFKVHEKKPSDTWSQVTFAKPSFIRECLNKYESLIWIDIDSYLKRLPTLKTDYMIDSPYDLAAVSRSDGVALDYLWYVRRTPATLKFFEDCADLIAKKFIKHEEIKVREGGDHYAMLEILENYKKENPGKFYLIGDRTFGATTGWITYGISGNETGRRQKPNSIIMRPVRFNRNAIVSRKRKHFGK